MRKSNQIIIKICIAAMLTALGFVLDRILTLPVTQALKINLAFIPAAFAAILLGPVWGACVWGLTDLIGAILIPFGTYHPGFTVCAALMGAVYGLFMHENPVNIDSIGKNGEFTLRIIHRKVRMFPDVILPVLINCILFGLIINTVWISMLYGSRTYFGWFLFRLLEYAVLIPVQIATMPLLLALSKRLKRQFKFLRCNRRMSYEQALDFIESTSSLGSKPGLSRIEKLCGMLGNPQKKVRCIHIAGTNGKGSVCAMLSEVLTASGIKTGLYTSPHLVSFEERIKINGLPIPAERLTDIIEQIRACAERMTDKPTEFEIATAAAFLYFAEEKCKIAVFETGLGGRLDATNIIEKPVLSVITGIALDHTAILGDTLEKIAAEKGGIIKKNRPLVLAACEAEATDVLERIAKEHGAPVIKTDYSRLQNITCSLEGTEFDFSPYGRIKIPLAGSYQADNAAVALTAAEVLRENGVKITDSGIISGLAIVSHRARFELLKKEPAVIYDGAHNPQGALALSENIDLLCGGRAVLLAGVMADKDYDTMANILAPCAEYVFTLTPDNPRALDGAKLCETFKAHGADAAACNSFDTGISRALEKAKKAGVPLVICGSLYMYSDIKSALSNYQGEKSENESKFGQIRG